MSVTTSGEIYQKISRALGGVRAQVATSMLAKKFVEKSLGEKGKKMM